MSDQRHEHEPAYELYADRELGSSDDDDPGPSDTLDATDVLGWPKLPEAVCAQTPAESDEQPPAAYSRARFPRVLAPIAIVVVLAIFLGGCLRACSGRHAATVVGSANRSSAERREEEASRSGAGSSGDDALAGRSRTTGTACKMGIAPRAPARARERRPLPTAAAISERSLLRAAQLDVEPLSTERRTSALAVKSALLANVRARLEFGFER